MNDSFKEIEDANDNKTVDEVVKQTITKLEAIKVKEDKLNSMESTHQTEQNNKCDNVNGSNNNQHTINELPDTGETDYSGPLAGAALLSGLALLSTRKNKKIKNLNSLLKNLLGSIKRYLEGFKYIRIHFKSSSIRSSNVTCH